jgi:hypothetical protein
LDEAESHQVFRDAERERHEFFSKMTLPGDPRLFDPHRGIGVDDMAQHDSMKGSSENLKYVHPLRHQQIQRQVDGTVSGLSVQFRNSMTLNTMQVERSGGGSNQQTLSGEGGKDRDEDEGKSANVPLDFRNTPCT